MSSSPGRLCPEPDYVWVDVMKRCTKGFDFADAERYADQIATFPTVWQDATSAPGGPEGHRFPMDIHVATYDEIGRVRWLRALRFLVLERAHSNVRVVIVGGNIIVVVPTAIGSDPIPESELAAMSRAVVAKSEAMREAQHWNFSKVKK